MKQLTLGQIIEVVHNLMKDGMTMGDICALPIYLGNDDELNGIHCGWYTNVIDANDPKDADFVELINEDRCNIELKGKAILIS